MTRRRKPPAYSPYSAPFDPNPPPQDCDSDSNSSSMEPRFGTLLNNELRRECDSFSAPRSHQLLNTFISTKITPSLPSLPQPPTWIPVSSVLLPTDLTGRVAILAHLKDPRRALVYLTKGEKHGKDIPLSFSWQFIRIVPKRLKSGPTFQYIAAPKMCISSKKGCWLLWKEFLDQGHRCLVNTKKSTRTRTVFMVPSYDTKKLTQDYERYVRGMEIPPPRDKLTTTGLEQFDLNYPTAEWRKVVCPLIQEKIQRTKEKYYSSSAQREDSDEERSTVGDPPPPPSHSNRPPQPRPPPRLQKRKLLPDNESDEEEEDGDGFKYNKVVDTGLSILTTESSEFKLLFEDEEG